MLSAAGLALLSFLMMRIFLVGAEAEADEFAAPAEPDFALRPDADDE